MPVFDFIIRTLHTAEKLYGISPLIFGILYFGSFPLCMISLAWLIRCLRMKKQIVLPGMITGFFFTASHLYLIIAGKNIPLWMYFVITLVVITGIASAIITARSQLSHPPEKPEK